ncbi:MAG: hypothetical protein ACW99A_04205, partial [Candidatus Kariarchaeaceae archaeon]
MIKMSLRTQQLFVALIAISIVQIQPIIAATGTFVAPTFPESEFNVTDSIISPAWDDITSFSNVGEFGQGGFVKFSHNTTHIFALLGTNMTRWIAIEFGSDGQDCMVPDNDAWVFYINDQDKSLQSLDTKYDGLSVPEVDNQNDLISEAIFTDELTYVETMRP